MSFWKSLVRGTGKLLTGDPGGAKERYNTQMDIAGGNIRDAYAQARPRYTQGMEQAGKALTGGWDVAQQEQAQGVDQARSAMQQPLMAKTKGELASRIMGEGGYSPIVMGKQRAGVIEDFGTQLKAGKQALRGQARGLQGELMARNISDVGKSRAKALRDLDISNEQLKRQEMTAALQQAPQLAQAEASFEQGAGQAIADMASKRGMSEAEFLEKAATGEGALTVEEAKLLAEIEAAKGSGQLSVDTQKGLLSSLV